MIYDCIYSIVLASVQGSLMAKAFQEAKASSALAKVTVMVHM